MSRRHIAEGNRSFTVQRLALVLSVALVVTTLSRVLVNDLVWDDPYFVPMFQRGEGLSGLWRFLSTPLWETSSFVAYDVANDYWRPLATGALYLGGQLFGDWVAGFHLLSLLGALGAAASLGLLTSRVLGERQRDLAVWTALLFSAHPLCAEVMCMTINLGDHLALLFINLQLIMLHDELTRPPNWSRRALAAAFALLACSSKEIGAVCALAPAFAWLLVRSHSEGLAKRALLRPWLWAVSVAPVALYLVLRGLVLSAHGRGASLFEQIHLSLHAAFLGFGRALQAIVAPLPHGANHYLGRDGWGSLVVAVAAWSALALVLFLPAIRRKISPLLLLALGWALAFLLPSLVTVKFSEGAWRIPTRYFHLPMAGVLICLAMYARRLQQNIRYLFPLVLVLLCLLSWVRIAQWQNQLSFYEAEAEYHPNSAFALSNLAVTYCEHERYDEGAAAVERFFALPYRPQPQHVVRALIARARVAAMRDGDLGSARQHLGRALEIQPRNVTAILTLTEVYAMSGQPERALDTVEEVLATWQLDGERRRLVERYRGRYLELTTPDAGDP